MSNVALELLRKILTDPMLDFAMRIDPAKEGAGVVSFPLPSDGGDRGMADLTLAETDLVLGILNGSGSEVEDEVAEDYMAFLTVITEDGEEMSREVMWSEVPVALRELEEHPEKWGMIFIVKAGVDLALPPDITSN